MSVDLESLINQSKERLSKHKEYLEKTSQRTNGGNPTNVAAIDDSASRRREEPSFSPLREPTNNNNSRQQQNNNYYSAGGNNTSVGSGSVFSPLGAPNSSRQIDPLQQQQQQFNPYSSNIARAGYNNYGEPEQQQNHMSQNRGHNSQNRSGFYLSSRTPTKVYDRGQKFVESRESYLERQRQEAWQKEMKDCTFSPFISRKAATMKSSGGNGGKSPSPEQPSNNTNKNEDKDEDELDNQQFLDWCVHSDKANVGFHVDAPSVFLHIQRQQDARKARAEGQSKLTVDTTHWKPKHTVPQEFNFGRTDQPIRSLRKPMLNMVRLSSGETMSRSGSAAGGAGGSSRSPASRRGTPRVSKSPVRLVPKKKKADDASDSDEEEKIRKMNELEQAQKEQQRQIKEQSEEIQKLSGMLSSMRMEAEAAKAKVREMTLSQTIAGGEK